MADSRVKINTPATGDAVALFAEGLFAGIAAMVAAPRGGNFSAIRFGFIPIEAIVEFTRAIFAWQEAKNNQFAKNFVARALLKTVTALAVSAAAVIAVGFAALAATVAPAILTAVMAAKSVFHFGAAIYYTGKGYAANKRLANAPVDQRGKIRQEQLHYYREAGQHLGGGIGRALFAVAIAGLAFFAKPLLMALGLLGIFGMFINVGRAAYKASKACTVLPPEIVDLRTTVKQKRRKHKGYSQTKMNREMTASIVDKSVAVNDSRVDAIVPASAHVEEQQTPLSSIIEQRPRSISAASANTVFGKSKPRSLSLGAVSIAADLAIDRQVQNAEDEAQTNGAIFSRPQ